MSFSVKIALKFSRIERLQVYPQVVDTLKAFTIKAEERGLSIDFGEKSLIMRWRQDESNTWNLGTITTAGKVWTEHLNGRAETLGRLHLSQAYLRKLAALVADAYVKETPKPTAWYVAKGGTYVTIDQLLAHEDRWLECDRRVQK